ncbi:MAG: DEAD/DEAH box helicase [Deltaproteobacteria bacterium]|nr:DEAD/DEAH box helicase [Deltaproteobacteria bacterium]
MSDVKSIPNIIGSMRNAPWYKGQISQIYTLPERNARCVPVPEGVHHSVTDLLEASDLTDLWLHQSQSLEMALAGQDIVVSTATASGKTFAFMLPVLDALARDEDATALFLYPLKALTNDQLNVLRKIEEATGIEMSPAVYDGDTPRARRPRIRQSARVVLTNPFEVHETLPYHHLWRRFFANLSYVVIDESHRYTGVFGSNVAQLIRRLLRVAEAYGSRPRFILASASIANPGEHASRLTSRRCKVVDEDGSPAGPRHLVFFDSTRADASSAHVQTRDVFAHLIREGLKTLCFTRSRKVAEFVAAMSLEGKHPLPVAPYRAGYLPEERRRLETMFKDGELRGMVSTSALELGIDIGDLDAVVICGYPGSISTFWQQVGRGGRRLNESLGVYVALDSIIDQYLVKNPDRLMSRKFETATIDLANEHILAGHMLCAAAELPVKVPEDQEPDHGVARGLAGKGLLHETDHGYVYAGVTRPQEAVKLDRIGDATVDLVDGETGDLLETVDLDRALREAFTGAVYLHQAQTWLVEELDLDALKARLRKKKVDYYTQARWNKTAEVMETFRIEPLGPAHASVGRIRLRQRVTGFFRKRYDRVVGGGDLDMPERLMETTAVWIDMEMALGKGTSDFMGAIHAMEHTLVGIAPLVLSCDPTDLAGFSTLMAPHSGEPSMYVYDGYEGGMGLADRVMDNIGPIMKTVRDVLAGCGCEKGCPACCLSPRCGNDNQPMDKNGAITLLTLLLGNA